MVFVIPIYALSVSETFKNSVQKQYILPYGITIMRYIIVDSTEGDNIMSNMVVKTNVLALNSHRNLGKVGNQQAKTSSRLSSGLRINTAADDAAGLGISEKMRAQIRGLDQASRNAQDGISLIRTAEGAMSTVNDMVTRIRELVVQASNDTNVGGTNAQSDRARIQDEINQLVQEIDATVGRTEFNTKTLLDGSLGRGASLQSISGQDIGEITSGMVTNGNFAGSTTKAQMDTINKFMNAANGVNLFDREPGSGTGVDGVFTNDDLLDEFAALDSAGLIGASGVDGGNVFADADALTSFMNSTNFENIRGAGGELYFQVGANTDQGVKLNIQSVDSATLGIGYGNGEATINVTGTSGEEIQAAWLDVLDNALAHVTSQRSNLGAMQNRMEYTIENLDLASENLSASESRIRDADMAKEMMKLTQANVLQQAATAMLAQANQAPQSVLQLIG